jgi:hypothetical protein
MSNRNSSMIDEIYRDGSPFRRQTDDDIQWYQSPLKRQRRNYSTLS